MNNTLHFEVVDKFTAAMREHGIETDAAIVSDGRLHRFRVMGDKGGSKNGWYVLHLGCLPAGAFGCWKRDVSGSWCAKSKQTLTDEEKLELSARIERGKVEQASVLQRIRDKCKARATYLFQKASDMGVADHAYVVARSIKAYGARLQGTTLIVPVRDADGELVGLQLIQADTSKHFLTGTHKAGSYHRIPGKLDRLLICEGFATGASLHEATGYAVAVAFDAGNLLPVAEAIRSKRPDTELVLCADDDAHRDDNPGLTKARAAALAVGGMLAVPDFGTERPAGVSDFNDLHKYLGLEAIRTCIAEATPPLPKLKASTSTAVLPGSRPKASDTESRLHLICAADIVPEPIDWLWEGWLARGKLAILAGAPGTGKTTLALAIASTITVAGRWPDKTPCRECGSVLVWSGEDDKADTLVPRLMAAGADLRRVHFLDGMYEEGEHRPFDPAKDIPRIAAALETYGDVRLLIIDPIVSAVSGDSHKANEVRRSLQPIVDYASKHRCAVIGITHFAKGTAGSNPLERVIGSQAFGALARIVMVAAKDEKNEGQRVLARAKSNIGADDGGVSYNLETVILDNGIAASRVTWGSNLTGCAREILGNVESVREAGANPVDRAMEFLLAALASGPVEQKTLAKDAQGAGHTPATIRRAKDKLDIVAFHPVVPGPWFWKLPENNWPENPNPCQGTHQNSKVLMFPGVSTLGKGERLEQLSGKAKKDNPAANDWEEGDL